MSTASQPAKVTSGTRVTTTFAASGTFTPPAAINATRPLMCDITVTGAGGGGAGASATTGGNGGNAGQVLQLSSVPITAATSITIGAAGTAGTAGATGGAGGSSAFGTYTAAGGVGGTLGGIPAPTPLMGNHTAGGTGGAARLFTCHISGSTIAASSPDGSTWTSRTMPSTGSWAMAAYGSGLFVANTNDGSNTYATSPDGITWTQRTMPGSLFPSAMYNQAIAAGNGLFVAVGYYIVSTPQGAAAVSSDGINWTSTGGAFAPNTYIVNVRYLNGLFIALGNTTASGNTTSTVLYTSPDGLTWTPRTLPTANNWVDVAYGANGTTVNYYVAVNPGASGSYSISTDGVNWGNGRSPGFGTDVGYGIVHNGTAFSVTGGSGTPGTVWSNDAFAWNSSSMPTTTGTWSRVVNAGGTSVATSNVSRSTVAVAAGGSALYSTAAMPATNFWNAVSARPAAAAGSPGLAVASPTPSGGTGGSGAVGGDGGYGGAYTPPTAPTTTASAAATAGQVPGAGGGGGGAGSTAGAAGAVGLVTVSYYQP